MDWSDKSQVREYHRQWKEKNKVRLKRKAIQDRPKTRAKEAEYRAKNPEKIKGYRRAWLLKNKNKEKGYYRKYLLKSQYGLTEAQFQKMSQSQCHLCWICDAKPKRLHVDHCHATGKIRGLLCGKCNSALGLFGDNPNLLRRAICYLKHSLDSGLFIPSGLVKGQLLKHGKS